MCDNCTRSAIERWDGFTSTCPGCQARAVSRSHAYFESKKQGHQTRRYQALLGTLGLSHEAVKAAAEADAAHKESV